MARAQQPSGWTQASAKRCTRAQIDRENTRAATVWRTDVPPLLACHARAVLTQRGGPQLQPARARTLSFALFYSFRSSRFGHGRAPRGLGVDVRGDRVPAADGVLVSRRARSARGDAGARRAAVACAGGSASSPRRCARRL